MGTFLVTPKMAPELAARIERSIGLPRRKPGGRMFAAQLRISLFRLGLLAAIVLAACLLVVARHRTKQELERERAALLDAVRAQDGALVADQEAFVSAVTPWLVRLAGAYEGDVVAGELRAPRAVGATVARPSVYVRGPIAAFAGAAGVAAALASSTKDSFVLCLLDPPASRAEKVLLRKLSGVYLGGAVFEQRTASVRRLNDAAADVPVLLPAFIERVRAARELRDVSKLQKELAQAPIEGARRAVGAELLIVVMDEPDEGGPAELDGERAHHARIGLVDLRSANVLLRLRRRVDPSWLSPATRSVYARMIDGCALALDVYDGAGG